MLLLFSHGSSQQVFSRGAHPADREAGGYLQVFTFKETEETLGMLLFLVGSFLEYVGNLDKPLLPGTRGEKVIAVAGLTLARE